MKKKNVTYEEREENAFSLSTGDLMAGLLFIFVLLLMGALLQVQEKAEQDEEIVKVNKITVENKTIYLERYETEYIAYSLSPQNATNKDVSFKSSNTYVVTVDNSGYVYARKKGNASITIQ